VKLNTKPNRDDDTLHSSVVLQAAMQDLHSFQGSQQTAACAVCIRHTAQGKTTSNLLEFDSRQGRRLSLFVVSVRPSR